MDIRKKELALLVPIYCQEIESIDISQYADYQFSEGYLQRKEKLIRQQKKVYYPLIKTAGRRIASAIAAAAIMGTMTVAAYAPARNAVKNFFLSIFATHSEISAVDSNNAAPKTIEDIYEITYDLSGFAVVDKFDYDTLKTKVYRNGDKVIIYEQYAESKLDISVNTEEGEISSIYVGDIEAMYIINDNLGYKTVIWDNGEYILIVTTNLGQNELIEIAESVQKVE